MTYNGTSWSNEFILNGQTDSFGTDSCVAPSFCMIVNQSGYETGR